MKFTAKVILIAFLIYFIGPHVAWWWIAIFAFIGGALIKTSGVQSFFAGAFGLGFGWIWTIMKIDISTSSILTDKIADLFSLGHRGLIIGLTIIIGSLVCALSAWTGHNFRKLFENRRRGYYK
jgi:hypothetical protein